MEPKLHPSLSVQNKFAHQSRWKEKGRARAYALDVNAGILVTISEIHERNASARIKSPLTHSLAHSLTHQRGARPREVNEAGVADRPKHGGPVERPGRLPSFAHVGRAARGDQVRALAVVLVTRRHDLRRATTQF